MDPVTDLPARQAENCVLLVQIGIQQEVEVDSNACVSVDGVAVSGTSSTCAGGNVICYHHHQRMYVKQAIAPLKH